MLRFSKYGGAYAEVCDVQGRSSRVPWQVPCSSDSNSLFKPPPKGVSRWGLSARLFAHLSKANRPFDFSPFPRWSVFSKGPKGANLAPDRRSLQKKIDLPGILPQVPWQRGRKARTKSPAFPNLIPAIPASCSRNQGKQTGPLGK